MRTAALYALEQELPSYIANTGLLTDELAANNIGASQGVVLTSTLSSISALDARLLPDEPPQVAGAQTDDDYTQLQIVRADIIQALGAIAAYDTGAVAVGNPRVLRAELYALYGYTEILLADLFCSGVPLSTVDFQQDFTYHASSTTAQVYQQAIVQEDSALALADTSTQVLNLARVLKGRALLALDSVASAAVAVNSVPPDFRYDLSVDWKRNQIDPYNLFNNVGTVADHEGRNGLPFLSSHDPRTTASVSIPVGYNNNYYVDLTFPAKYSPAGFSPFAVADGIEAELIQAEAAYRAGNPTGMVGTLNQLRQTATVAGQTATPIPGTLTDPGASLAGSAADSARVTLLFDERAYWLFLTGHRQGDLRRLMRQYGQWYHNSSQVYPTGPYFGLGTRTYGTDVTAPIPGTEYLNPLFHGCLNRVP